MVLKNTKKTALLQYIPQIEHDPLWPNLPNRLQPPIQNMSDKELRKSMLAYFCHKKSNGSLADLIFLCNEDEMPRFITETIAELTSIVG